MATSCCAHRPSSAPRFCGPGPRRRSGPASELRLRDLQVIVTVKLPIAEGKPTPREITDAAVLCATALQVLKTAGLRPVPLTADRYVRLMSTLLNWDAQAGWRDRIVPECDPISHHGLESCDDPDAGARPLEGHGEPGAQLGRARRTAPGFQPL